MVNNFKEEYKQLCKNNNLKEGLVLKLDIIENYLELQDPLNPYISGIVGTDEIKLKRYLIERAV